MGKHPLSETDKKRIIDLLEDIHPSKRDVFMQNAASFAKWLAGACYDIYIKIKNFLSSVGDAIGDFFGWLFND